MVTVEKEVDAFNKHTRRLPEAERIPAVAEAARRNLLEAAAPIEAALEGKEWLVGGRFTAADLMTSAVLGWAKLLGILSDRPRLEDYVRRCVSRPAAKRSRVD
jgi:glutathione S-transferase